MYRNTIKSHVVWLYLLVYFSNNKTKTTFSLLCCVAKGLANSYNNISFTKSSSAWNKLYRVCKTARALRILYKFRLSMPIITAMCCFMKILVLLQKLILVHFTIETLCWQKRKTNNMDIEIQILLPYYYFQYSWSKQQICAKPFFLDWM